MKKIDELNIVHPGYAKNAALWDYYIRSYLGSKEYRDGAYLRKYLLEDSAPGDHYKQRLEDTPLQNHVKSVVETYRAFLFRTEPLRELGKYTLDPFVERFSHDVDLRGNDMTAFMREVNDTVSVYGGAWINVDRPNYRVETAAQEIELDIRAYANLYNPTTVLDWSYKKGINGRRSLDYIKVIDERGLDTDIVICWYRDRIERYELEKDVKYSASIKRIESATTRTDVYASYGKILSSEEYENPLGYIPFVFVSTDRSSFDGIGYSEIGDIADLQRSIYNKLSELYQTIRISSHPTLVKDVNTGASAGAGAVINVPEDSTLQPYLLQPTGASIDGILNAIQLDVDSIETVSHLKAVRAKASSGTSGVAMQTERQLLNAKLADKATALERAEEAVWQMWFDWQGLDLPDDFNVYYEKSFDFRDKHSDLDLYIKSLGVVPNESFRNAVYADIVGMVLDDDEDIYSITREIKSEE